VKRILLFAVLAGMTSALNAMDERSAQEIAEELILTKEKLSLAHQKLLESETLLAHVVVKQIVSGTILNERQKNLIDSLETQIVRLNEEIVDLKSSLFWNATGIALGIVAATYVAYRALAWWVKEELEPDEPDQKKPLYVLETSSL
jgi:hypothetical protein